MKKRIHRLIKTIDENLNGRLLRSTKFSDRYHQLMSGRYDFGEFEIYIPPGRIDAWTDDAVEEFILEQLDDGVFWDIGANIGYFSISAAKNSKKIRCFEPEENNYNILKRNINENKFENIHLHKIAVSNKNGTAEFFTNSSVGSGIHSLAYDERLNSESQTVETRTFDSLVSEYEKPDLVKIDVEGAELKIIEGADCALKNNNISWFIEIHSPRTGERVDRIGQHGGDVDSLYKKLSENGYYIYGFNSNETENIFSFSIEETEVPLYWYATKQVLDAEAP